MRSRDLERLREIKSEAPEGALRALSRINLGMPAWDKQSRSSYETRLRRQAIEWLHKRKFLMHSDKGKYAAVCVTDLGKQLLELPKTPWEQSWSAAEIDSLSRHYLALGSKVMSERLGRSQRAIVAKANRMGLRRTAEGSRYARISGPG